MNTKFKQFGDCIQQLQIEENYFGRNEAKKSAGTPGERALRLCKDPTFLLFKLTERPEMVKCLLALLRVWTHGTK